MDIKIHCTKKKCVTTLALLCCGLIAITGWYLSPQKARYDIKMTCRNNCGCFDNVVDYRLTNNQARSFARFIKELGKRKDANVLEFMDSVDAISIQQSFAVCQPQKQISVGQETTTDKTKK